ncbi:Alkaline phosphatase [Acinetobacter haemolyticus CIP 64.3 = MTCC 9819]|uniref:Alkaline phosphatase n=1 Tax=Acinetobacter haemolyticus CIP 64.3 = MTCC 9819 TaxID=1217659 RepID=N9GJK6_ACIHA|nr:alkaline phosphatase [Acinetobacter haemolyticus]ENW19680.1 hypothetical protein F927_01097 [Acinetobacter haemolyticus CIP 64.3 = MTCC 9819]EPR88694.1 Alkaline phosphatase [Acinetobacter haemolyticus CIP 64.3 = MTCC 9819]NAR97479.1 alkaline phosphatase [Acinetobacter haemolyticus]QXZ26101.1 alkaline phosphatase [Acinetobacter haemolyticus]WPO68827.1 alkaline phosphatase [Acinetobacter haemolyticus]
MKLKPLLLPILITSLLFTACGGDDNNYSSSNQPLEKPKPPVTTPQFDGELLEVGANGNVSEFGGATRLKKERTQAMRESLSDKTVKHVILFIGDGTSDSEITAARNYAEGAAGYFKGLDVLPFTGSYTTYSLNKDGEVDYVTDSAASATAWASGIKTYNNALGLDIRGNHHATLLELAKKAGFATGNVTTTELQDATPAALVSHISARKCYGPNETTKRCPESALENGGLGSITEQLLTTRADVTLGGGKKTFYEVAKAGPFKDKTLLERAKLENYRIVEDLNSLKAVDSANQNQPLLGLFADGNLPVIWSGPVTQLNGHKKGAESCRDNSAFSIQTPRLAQMTEKAIELLSNNEKGFFLQVESGSIDKRNHAADPCGQIGETVQLDEAIQVALKFAKEHGETLIVVTGDHAHTSQIIPINGDSPGQTAALKTKDGVAMAINYGTAPEGSSQHHTGAQVRIAAYGPRAANVSGLLDQTDLFFIIRDALGIQQNASR